MAIRVANNTTPDIAVAGDWDSVTNTPTIHASTNITLSGSKVYSAAFTAPNTTNACTGVLVYLASKSTATTITVNLEENSVPTAASKTITLSALPAAGWMYFRFDTPYVFTSTAANYYRFSLVRAASGTPTVASDSAGSNFAYLATDDRTGAPASNDNIWVVGANDAATTPLTVSGVVAIGAGTAAGLSGDRNVSAAVMVANGGQLIYDPAISTSVTCTGCMVIGYGGLLQIGTAAVPYPADKTAQILFAAPANDTGSYGLVCASASDVVLQGAPRTNAWKTMYASGSGTTADPLVIDAIYTLSDVAISIASPAVVTKANHGLYTGNPVMLSTTGALPTGLAVNTQYYVNKIDSNTFYLTATKGGANLDTSGTQSGVHTLQTNFEVNEKIVVYATSDSASNYLEAEVKYIKTAPSATSYTLSSTAGGAEAGFTYTHNTNARILSLTNNVKIASTTSYYSYVLALASRSTTGTGDLDWATFYMMGGSSNAYPALQLNGGYFNADNCVIDTFNRYGFSTSSVTGVGITYTNLLACNGTYSGSGGGVYTQAKALHFTDCYVVKSSSHCWYFSSAAASTITRCEGNAGATGTNGILNISSSNYLTFTDCEFHCSRTYNTYINGILGCKFINCNFGTKGDSTSGYCLYYAALVNQAIFVNCNFDFSPVEGTSKTLAESMVEGALLSFHELNDATDQHYWITPYGLFSSSGTGLTDTTCRTAGGFSQRCECLDASDLAEWEFYIPCGDIQNEAVTITCWVKINSATFYAGTHTNPTLTVDYDNGTEVAAVATDTTDWQKLQVSFVPATTYGRLTIRLTAATDATLTDAYWYVDDFGGGFLVNTGLDLWADGQPVPPVWSFLINAADLWGASDTVSYGANTMGERLKLVDGKADIADAVWDEAAGDHVASGTFGKLLKLIKNLVS